MPLTKEQQQSLFDRAAKALIKQGARATSDGGGCSYQIFHSVEGQKVERRCAIGWLMPDDGSCLRSVVFIRQLLASHSLDELGGEPVGPEDAPFLSELQACHDDTPMSHGFLAAFKRNAAVFADIWGLSRGVLDA